MKQSPSQLQHCFVRKFKSEQNRVSLVVSELETWMRADQTLKARAEDVSIALAETLNNVVEHAYKNKSTGDIALFAGVESDQLCIEIRDFGEQFPGIPNPRDMDGPEQDFDNLPEGGFGWFLIHSLTSKIESDVDEQSNCLRLFFDCKDAN